MIIVGAYDSKANYVTGIMAVEERQIERTAAGLAVSCAKAGMRPDEFEVWKLADFDEVKGKVKADRKTLYDGVDMMRFYEEARKNEQMLQRMEQTEDNPGAER